MTATLALDRLPAGFVDPGLASQAVFRHALDAMARPGRCHTLTPQDTGALSPPQGLSVGMAALLLTLLDAETTLWLSPALDDTTVRGWLGFHTGVQLVRQPDAAAYLAARAHELDLPLWQRIDRGSDDRPQDGATLLLEVNALDEAPGLQLRGPGIAAFASLSVAGVADTVWQARAAEQAHYPLGVDLLISHGTRFAALPRSTRLALEA